MRCLRSYATAITAAVVTLVPAVAGAQNAEPRFQRLVDDFQKPYLTFSMLLQAVGDYQIDRTLAGNNGFSLGNVRARVFGTLDGGFGYFFQASLLSPATIIDARLSYAPSASVGFDVGQFKVPFGREFLVYAANIDFVNRATVVGALVPGRQLGGQAWWKPTPDVTLTVGAFNGNSFLPNQNDNSHLLWAARSTVQLTQGVSLGANVAISDDQDVTLARGQIPNFAGTRTLVGGDARIVRGPVLVAGELIYARLDPSVGAVQEPWGFQVTGGYHLSPKTQILVRWDGFDLDAGGQRQDILIGGFNIWPTRATEFQVNYLIDVNNADVDQHQLLVNFQIGF